MNRVVVNGEQELQNRLRALGPAARRTKRRALGRAAKDIATRMKRAADGAGFEKSTGATRRSIGLKRLRSGEITIGVRYDYIDRRTGKVPNKYAGTVHQRNPWFAEEWDSMQDGVASNILTELNNEIAAEARR